MDNECEFVPLQQEGVLPWTRSCFVCGAENEHGLKLKSRVKDGRVELRYTTRPHDVGYKAIVHGGILMTLMDEVMTWAAILAMGGMCVAAEMSTRLKFPLGVGADVIIRGWVSKKTGRLCLTGADVLDLSGQIYASATGKYMPMRGELLSLSEKDFVSDGLTLDLAGLFGRSNCGRDEGSGA